MPLEAPNLDDRRFDDILRELRDRIPVYTREWTDFNESDPGIALLQLFAWLTETTLYRLNRVPERNYIKFLQLFGFERRAAMPAVTHLAFVVDPGVETRPVKKGAAVSVPDPGGGEAIVFETERALDLIRAELTDVRVFDGGSFVDVTQINAKVGGTYRPFGWVPAPGNALYLGFTPPKRPVAHRIFPAQMSLRVFLPPEAMRAEPAVCRRDEHSGETAPLELVWEYRPSVGAPWRRLNVLADETWGFAHEGYVRLRGPDEIEPTSEARVADPRYWLRCRLERSVGPPDFVPLLEAVQPNTVEARQLSTVRDDQLGVSDGTPDQTFRVRRPPIFVSPEDAHDPLRLRVVTGDGEGAAWARRDDFLGSTSVDPHYVLNAASGEVRFGDGARGMIPAPGSAIVATEYRAGGGAAANRIVPSSKWTLLAGVLGVKSVNNRRFPEGGRDEEAEKDLRESAPRRLRARDRAVTAEDFGCLTSEIGGVAKAIALAEWHPEFPGVEVPGSITVVVLPSEQRERCPAPSRDLVDVVCRRLNDVRLITTEVHVVGPSYQSVRVEARVEADPRASFDEVASAVATELDRSLSPYERKFGAHLMPSELYAVILRAHADVTGVATLNVVVDGRRRPLEDRIEVPVDGLLCPDEHVITVVPTKGS